MNYIKVHNSLVYYNPAKIKLLDLKTTEDGSVLNLQSLLRNVKDAVITYDNPEEANRAFKEIFTIMERTAYSVLDITGKDNTRLEFIEKQESSPILQYGAEPSIVNK